MRPYLSVKSLGLPYFKENLSDNKIDYEEFSKKHHSKYFEALKRKKFQSVEKFRSLTNTKLIEERNSASVEMKLKKNQKFSSGKVI